jgi:hypothetical protein
MQIESGFQTIKKEIKMELKPKYKIEFNEKNHRYKLEGGFLPSVTGILEFFPKPALLRWYKSLTPEQIAEQETKGKGIGTDVHNAFERVIKGEKVSIETEYPIEVQTALKSALEWLKSNKIEVIATELPVGSKEYLYCGKIDCIAKLNNDIVLFDWKTSKGFFVDMKLQVLAYQQAFKETYGIEVDKCIIVRFDKNTGIPEPFEIPKEKWELYFYEFRNIKEVYNFIKEENKK